MPELMHVGSLVVDDIEVIISSLVVDIIEVIRPKNLNLFSIF